MDDNKFDQDKGPGSSDDSGSDVDELGKDQGSDNERVTETMITMRKVIEMKARWNSLDFLSSNDMVQPCWPNPWALV